MAELRQSLARADDDSALTELRHQRRAIALQIAAIELGSPRQRGVDTEGSSAMLSELAAAILQQLLEVAGIADEVAIIALGKMGGWELNYASDIDLLFVCREAPARYENALRQLIAKLELNRAPTRLYRVDLRLRPYGRSGPLVSSLAALQKYYERSAAPWERQAMIRASHGAGSTALSAEVFAALESFRWKNPVDDRAIQSLLELRRRTRAQTRELDRHLKQGPGGIRSTLR